MLEWTAEIAVVQGTQVLKFSGLSRTRIAINNLASLNLFESTVAALKATVIFTTGNDSLQIQTGEGNLITNNLNLLKILTENFLNVLLRTLPQEDPNSVNIKLPPVPDFDELSKVSREIHLALTQPILNDEINGETKIVSVENGSIWFNVLVGVSALPVVAALAWSAAVVYKKIQEGHLMAHYVKNLKIKNDALEEMQKAQKAEIDLVIKAEAEFIDSSYFKNAAPENIERLKKSITTFAELIGKGAEIHPAIASPENVSNLFPDLKNLIGLESKIKKIANE